MAVPPTYVVPGVVLTTGLIAAVTDVWKFKIYNALTLPVLAGGLLYYAVAELPIPDRRLAIGFSVSGMLLGALVFLLPVWKGGMGAGDLKLMAALGAWLGPWNICVVALIACLAGGIYAGILLARRRRRGGQEPVPPTPVTEALKHPDRRERAVPYGAMVAVALVTFFLWNAWRA